MRMWLGPPCRISVDSGIPTPAVDMAAGRIPSRLVGDNMRVARELRHTQRRRPNSAGNTRLMMITL